MKVLVFAHVPPPHHGQSYMVQLMLAGFGGDRRRNGTAGPVPYPIECYHVNARVSKRLEDIGEYRMAKLLLMMWYCLEAIWCRFRYGVENFYYIPAPGKKSALYRDWLVMFLCRPFFKRLILHWHAAGLAKWLETCRQIRSRSITFRFMKHVDLSIVLSNFNRIDAEKLMARRVVVVGNGIADPCPDFEQRIFPRRVRRHAARTRLLARQPLEPGDLETDPSLYRVLFLAHCMREKGLFDTIEGVARANRKLAADGSPLRMHLTVAGEFVSEAEKAEFDRVITQPDLQRPVPVAGGKRLSNATTSLVDYRGFVRGAEKNRLFEECDCFCFPTYYNAESFGLVLIEAMSFGMHVVTSRWRSIPELMPEDDSGLLAPRNPQAIAEALLARLPEAPSRKLRERFVKHYTFEQHLNALADAICSVGPGSPEPRTTGESTP